MSGNALAKSDPPDIDMIDDEDAVESSIALPAGEIATVHEFRQRDADVNASDVSSANSAAQLQAVYNWYVEKPVRQKAKLLSIVSLSTAAVFLIVLQMQGVGSASVAVWATIFLSSMVSSVVGFAFSAIAGSVLFHIDKNYLHAVETMLIASISLQAYSIYYLRKSIDLKVLTPFLVGGAATLLVGVYIVIHINPKLLMLAIGSFLVVYGLYTASGKVPRLKVTGVVGDVFAGAMGGITGPLAAFPGPFVSIWGGLKGWDKTMQRSITQPYILVMQLLTLGLLAAMGKAQITMEWSILQYMIPAIGGSILGLRLFERLNNSQFLVMIAGFLTISGIAMIAKTM